MNAVADLAVSALGGAIVAYAALKFLATSFIRHQLDKAAQTHIVALTQRTEGLKAQLSIYAHEQNVALSRVDAQRAEALQRIYASLRDWFKSAAKIATGSSVRNADAQAYINFFILLCDEANVAAKRMLETLADNAIYLDSDLYATIAALAEECATAGAAVLVPLRRGPAERWSTTETANELELCRQVFQREYYSVYIPLLQSLTERFRENLGTLRRTPS